MEQKPKNENLGYDDDRFYDVESVASSQDCTGLIPTPPKSEAEAISYGELTNLLHATEESVNNGLQKIKKNRKKDKK